MRLFGLEVNCFSKPNEIRKAISSLEQQKAPVDIIERLREDLRRSITVHESDNDSKLT